MLPEPIRILVFWDPHRTSGNQRLHWAERAKRNRAAKDAAIIGWLNAGKPSAAGPVEVSVIVARGRRMDEDNIWSGLKPVCDVIFTRVTPDDSPAWVHLGTVTQECGKKWKARPEVEFVIVPLEIPS